MVLAESHGISRAPCYLGTRTARQQRFRLRDSHPLRPGTHTGSTIALHSHARAGRPGTTRPTTPMMQPLPGLTHHRFGLFRVRSPLLTESLLFSLPVGTEMFHFPTFPPPALCVQAGVTGHDSSRVSPFGHPRITARLTAPRGLSQPPTSPGSFVPVEETIASFKALCDGTYDHLPEQAFFMAGGIEDVEKNAAALAKGK